MNESMQEKNSFPNSYVWWKELYGGIHAHIETGGKSHPLCQYDNGKWGLGVIPRGRGIYNGFGNFDIRSSLSVSRFKKTTSPTS